MMTQPARAEGQSAVGLISDQRNGDRQRLLLQLRKGGNAGTVSLPERSSAVAAAANANAVVKPGNLFAEAGPKRMPAGKLFRGMKRPTSSNHFYKL